MKLVLDTNRYSDLILPVREVEQTIAQADEVFLPFVVLAELYYGYRNGNQRTENERRLKRFLTQPGIRTLYPDSATVSIFADLRSELRRRGTPIPIHDLWIAALTLQHGFTLYSRDRHFDFFPQMDRI